MKRIALFFATFISISFAFSQDTIRFGDGIYMYDDTIFPTGSCHYITIPHYNFLTDGYPVAKAYYSEGETLVYGVAIAMRNIVDESSYHAFYHELADSIDLILNRYRCGCFWATLYQKTGDSLVMVDTAPWVQQPLERMIEYTGINRSHVCDVPIGDTVKQVVHMYELYFPQPHRVHDTFYVGKYDRTEKRVNVLANPEAAECAIIPNHPNYAITLINDLIVADETSECSAKWIWFPDFDRPNEYAEGFCEYTSQLLEEPNHYTNIFSYIHPILQPRYDLCYAPGKPWMTARTGTTATFEWGQIDDSAQLAIGDYLGDPDTMDAIALGPGSTGHTVAGLEPGSYHGAWLRQRCHWQLQEGDSARWSDWSERVIFSTDLEGVAAAEPVQMSVYPNPAHGSFTVETDAQQARLALYDLHGTELYAVGLRSARTTIGIADLPRGVYFLVLTTLHGTATRRLVNEP